MELDLPPALPRPAIAQLREAMLQASDARKSVGAPLPSLPCFRSLMLDADLQCLCVEVRHCIDGRAAGSSQRAFPAAAPSSPLSANQRLYRFHDLWVSEGALSDSGLRLLAADLRKGAAV